MSRGCRGAADGSQELGQLRKENFNLKLRIYYMENDIMGRLGLASADIVKLVRAWAATRRADRRRTLISRCSSMRSRGRPRTTVRCWPRYRHSTAPAPHPRAQARGNMDRIAQMYEGKMSKEREQACNHGQCRAIDRLQFEARIRSLETQLRLAPVHAGDSDDSARERHAMQLRIHKLEQQCGPAQVTVRYKWQAGGAGCSCSIRRRRASPRATARWHQCRAQPHRHSPPRRAAGPTLAACKKYH